MIYVITLSLLTKKVTVLYRLLETINIFVGPESHQSIKGHMANFQVLNGLEGSQSNFAYSDFLFMYPIFYMLAGQISYFPVRFVIKIFWAGTKR